MDETIHISFVHQDGGGIPGPTLCDRMDDPKVSKKEKTMFMMKRKKVTGDRRGR